MVEIEALRGIDLELHDGDRLGLIGPNGAGKSTLLKVLAGLYQPTDGAIDRKGRTETLFDLSLLDMEASGSDNIRLLIAIRGIGREEADALFARIAEFSELEYYLDLPVRTYSGAATPCFCRRRAQGLNFLATRATKDYRTHRIAMVRGPNRRYSGYRRGSAQVKET
jgi:ABC-type polysaccharide/polyol phosphate transport system ATPase subunit